MDREEGGWGELEEWRDGLRLLCAPFPRGFSGEETLASCSCKNLADLPGMDFYQQMTAHCLGMSAAITRCLVGVGFGGGVSIMLLPQRQWADRGQRAGGRHPPQLMGQGGHTGLFLGYQRADTSGCVYPGLPLTGLKLGSMKLRGHGVLPPSLWLSWRQADQGPQPFSWDPCPFLPPGPELPT